MFSIASSASPSKVDGMLNSDVRSPDSPSRLDPAGLNQCAFHRDLFFVLLFVLELQFYIFTGFVEHVKTTQSITIPQN